MRGFFGAAPWFLLSGNRVYEVPLTGNVPISDSFFKDNEQMMARRRP
jgi:hypothetical protein